MYTNDGEINMTTIAIDENLVIASDSMMSVGGFIESYDIPKIFEVGGYRVGVAGRYAEALIFVEALDDLIERDNLQSMTHIPIPQSQLDQMNLDDFMALVITPEGEVICYEGSNYPIPLTPPVSIGSGSMIARVAMECGKSAVEAVQEAIKFDVYSGGEIQVLEPSEIEVPSREGWSKLTKQQILDKVFINDED